ncbi:hypothetical protein LIER_43877 [Lithospermum erythrorhizon]|uniref:Uncharacterized protein n=1 Tax=Lithospermum erythrorhizon TaxID=34254 RepID=A0AAV3R5K7_LITER
MSFGVGLDMVFINGAGGNEAQSNMGVGGLLRGLTERLVYGLDQGLMYRMNHGLIHGLMYGLNHGLVNGLSDSLLKGLVTGLNNRLINGLSNGQMGWHSHNGLDEWVLLDGLLDWLGRGLLNRLENGLGLGLLHGQEGWLNRGRRRCMEGWDRRGGRGLVLDGGEVPEAGGWKGGSVFRIILRAVARSMRAVARSMIIHGGIIGLVGRERLRLYGRLGKEEATVCDGERQRDLSLEGRGSIDENGQPLPICLTAERVTAGISLSGWSKARLRNMRGVVVGFGESNSRRRNRTGGHRTLLRSGRPVSGLISGHGAAGDEGR